MSNQFTGQCLPTLSHASRLVAFSTGMVLALTACMGSDSSSGPAAITSTSPASTVTAPNSGPQSTVGTAPTETGNTASGTGAFSPAQANAPGNSTPTQFDVTLFSPDGTKIVATVFVPKIVAGAAIPLLLHSHGFGGTRVTTLDFDEATQTSEVGIDTMQMAYNAKAPVVDGRPGWYVISYDQRGHGQSEGQVEIMNPTKEGEDFKTVLNWAEQNLPHLAYRTKDGRRDPVIGSIGRSYGGAYQLMGVGVDPRVDVIIPGGTWYDLRYSLNPNGVPKTTYLNGLVAGGAESNRGRYPDFILRGLADANTTGNVNATTISILGANGTVSYCEGGRTQSPNGLMVQRNVPAFFVQGLRDVLFNANEAVLNYECFYRLNPKGKLLFTRYGHSLHGLNLQEAPVVKDGKYSFYESRIWLGGNQASCPTGQLEAGTNRCIVNLKDLMFQFLVEHLYGSAEAASVSFLGKTPSPFPQMVAVLDDTTDNPTAVELPKLASANRVKVPGNAGLADFSGPQMVVTGIAGLPAASGGTPLSALQQLNSYSYFPIVKAGVNAPGACLIGKPEALVEISSPAPLQSPDAPIVYVGLAVKTEGEGTAAPSYRLLHEQVTPVKGYGTQFVDLPGISVKLGNKETLEMVAGGFSAFFVSSFNRVPTPVSVRAAVSLPLPTVSGSVCPAPAS